MLALIGFLLIVGLVLVVLGFAVEGLMWLALIGIVLFIGTEVWGWLKRKTRA